MEGTITIMADTQITTEAIQVMAMEDTQTIIMVGTQIIMEVIQTIMEDIQVTVTGVTQAMVMEYPNNNQNNGYPGNSFGAPRSDKVKDSSITFGA